jgi:hypothetical protein
VRVAGTTMVVRARAASAVLALPASHLPFAARRGGDIRLELVRAPVPEPAERGLLFDSGMLWRVHRHAGGLLYTFRSPAHDPETYKGVAIDRGLREGLLYFPHARTGRRPDRALEFPLDELLFQHRLAREGAAEVHACGILIGGKAVVFCGRSGAGKTTTARLWRRQGDVTILSDDRIVLREHRGSLLAFGTPWHGVGGFAAPDHGRLGVVCFLRHTKKTALRPLGPAEAAARLFARSFPPLWDRVGVTAVLRMCSRVAETIPCYDLGFRPDRSAVEAVGEMIGN